jgi:hypothetical protein
MGLLYPKIPLLRIKRQTTLEIVLFCVEPSKNQKPQPTMAGVFHEKESSN